MATVPDAEPGASAALSARDPLLTPDSLAPIVGIGIVILVPCVRGSRFANASTGMPVSAPFAIPGIAVGPLRHSQRVNGTQVARCLPRAVHWPVLEGSGAFELVAQPKRCFIARDSGSR